LAAFAAVILPGYKARVILLLLFGIEWQRFMVNFSNGSNFAWHFSLGIFSVLIDVIVLVIIRFTYRDFIKYREDNSNQIPLNKTD